MVKSVKKITKRQQILKNVIIKRKNYVLHINQLPLEVLEKIISNVNIWNRNRVRATCRRFKFACDNVLMHDYRKSLQTYKSEQENYQYMLLKVIHQSTWPYVKIGFCPLFVGMTLGLLRNYYNNTFGRSTNKIKFFLKKFYNMIDESLGDPCEQKSRLLYILALLSFMYKIDNTVQKPCVHINDRHLRLEFEMEGAWLGMLWSSSRNQSFQYPNDRSKLLIILSEIMISSNSKKAFRKVLECYNKIFVYGNECINSGRVFPPRVEFKFDIEGHERVLSFIKIVPITEEWNTREFPTDEFNVNLRINCREALKWGCYQNYDFEIGPYYDSEKNSSNNKNNVYNFFKY